MSTLSKIPATTQERVLAAALEVFRESGYRASIDAVARRAGVARQTIYNNFESKEALFATAVAGVMGDLLAELEGGDGDWRSRLTRFSLQFRSRVFAEESANMRRLLIAEARQFPELARDFYQNTILSIRRRMAVLIERAMQEGCLRADDPQEAAHIYLALLMGADDQRLMFEGMLPDLSQDPSKVERAITLFLRLYALPESPCLPTPAASAPSV